MKQYKVFFTHTFNKMFKYHLRKYSTYSTTYALKIEKELVEFIRFLKTFPYATPVVKFIGNNQNYRKHIIKKRFLIIFKIKDNNVYLLYFIDGRMSPENYFKLYKN